MCMCMWYLANVCPTMNKKKIFQFSHFRLSWAAQDSFSSNITSLHKFFSCCSNFTSDLHLLWLGEFGSLVELVHKVVDIYLVCLCSYIWTLHQPHKDSLTFIQSAIFHGVPIKSFLCTSLPCEFLSIVLYLLRSNLNHHLYSLRYSCDRIAADKCFTLAGVTMNKWCSVSFL